ncbi:hypothetical protein MKW94_018621 [Papaver nudicaule]|uniref:U-box domain-containing protein n=1 Tax=Papaver nudicaule TaxID=74823 RepID=A0AA42B463_PAPNU|nr:hypothetical protein [Papaver nudicaule]
MKTHHGKLKTPPRPLFSCGIFRNCTESVLSPTTPNPNSHLPSSNTLPSPPLSDPQPPHSATNVPKSQTPPQPESESSSSSSTTSQSFTQWRFPVQNPSTLNQQYPVTESTSNHKTTQEESPPPPPPPPPQQPPCTNLAELYHVAEIQLRTGTTGSRLLTLHLLERSLVPNPPTDVSKEPTCPITVMKEIVRSLKDKEGAKPATKVLLALCLTEKNRHVAVEAGAVMEVVEVLTELDGAAAERALAALELICTVEEGVAEIRAHALAVPMLVEVMGRMVGRGKESAISVLAAIYCGGGGGGGEMVGPPEEVGRAVFMALQGECSARGRRKGTMLLKVAQENGRLDFGEEGGMLMLKSMDTGLRFD